MIRRALLLAVAAAVALGTPAAVPAVAQADSDAIFEDCQDGRLDKRYSDADLRAAIADLPPDLDEYTNCRELIRSAQQGVRGGGGSGPGSQFNGADGFGALPAGEGGLPLGPDSRPIDPVGIASPEERAEIEGLRAGDRAGVGRVPSSAGVSPGDSGADLPLPLVVLLLLCAAAAIAAAAPRVKALVERRRA